MAKKVQFTTNQPSASTDYLAADNTWKTMGGGGGGVPTTRTLTINGTAQDLSADRTWNVGDMLIATYDTDVDGVVDSAERIQIVVRNSTGSTLTKGQIVYLSGATGNRPNAVLAQADTEATSSKTIGMVIANIANNSDGQIAVNGTLHDIDTSAFSAGDSLWLSATTAGGMVANTPPSEPNHSVFIGYVARAHPTLGRIVLAIQNGYELDELHGVKITSVANNDILKYNSSNGLWENSNALSTKQDTITGAASTITSSNLTGSRALVSNGGGKVDVSAVTTTELGRLVGVTSDIQTQLNAKQGTITLTTTGTSGSATLVGSTLNVPQYASGMTYQLWNFQTSNVINGSTTTWIGVGQIGGSNESTAIVIIPHAMTLTNMYLLHYSGNQPATGSQVITVRKNAVDTALVITIAAGASPSATPYSNTSNPITFAAGDRLSIRRVNNATGSGGAFNGLSFSIQ